MELLRIKAVGDAYAGTVLIPSVTHMALLRGTPPMFWELIPRRPGVPRRQVMLKRGLLRSHR